MRTRRCTARKTMVATSSSAHQGLARRAPKDGRAPHRSLAACNAARGRTSSCLALENSGHCENKSTASGGTFVYAAAFAANLPGRDPGWLARRGTRIILTVSTGHRRSRGRRSSKRTMRTIREKSRSLKWGVACASMSLARCGGRRVCRRARPGAWPGDPQCSPAYESRSEGRRPAHVGVIDLAVRCRMIAPRSRFNDIMRDSGVMEAWR
jgi:hypothetical protein